MIRKCLQVLSSISHSLHNQNINALLQLVMSTSALLWEIASIHCDPIRICFETDFRFVQSTYVWKTYIYTEMCITYVWSCNQSTKCVCVCMCVQHRSLTSNIERNDAYLHASMHHKFFSTMLLFQFSYFLSFHFVL